MTLEEFFKAVRNTNSAIPTWRWGQTCFNVLSSARPDLAERIRGTTSDPFHVINIKDERYARFVEFLEAHWE